MFKKYILTLKKEKENIAMINTFFTGAIILLSTIIGKNISRYNTIDSTFRKLKTRYNL